MDKQEMPFKLTPYEHQLKSIALSKELTDMGLLWGMGSGKTGCVINILRKKYTESSRMMRTLVLCPVVTINNWAREFDIHSYIKPEHVVPLAQRGSKGKIKRMNETILDPTTGTLSIPKILIMNYEGLQSKEVFEIIRAWSPEIIIADESHYIKNPKAKRSKAVVILGDQAKHRYILTGTPILNNAEDIFMQFRFLDRGDTFAKNYYVFQRMYMHDANSAWSNTQQHYPKWELREDKFAELHEKIYRKCTRVVTTECIDLPPLIKQNIKLTMSVVQAKHYKQMERDLITFVNDDHGNLSGAMVANAAVVKALRLMQIASGYLVDDEGKAVDIKDNPKIKQTEELLEQLVPEHKVILWCTFKQNYKQLSALCKKLKIEHVFLTGEQNTQQKQESMDAFENDEKCRVIIANRRAGGIGVNLVAADYSIIYSRNFSLGEELQSEARNYRGGSQQHERIVKIDLTMEGTIEDTVQEALSNKQDISDKIIDTFRR